MSGLKGCDLAGDAFPRHYIQIEERLCNGCVLCAKVCPTKAIRVKEGRVARIEGTCIDCGECLRACPRGAVKAITAGGEFYKLKPLTIISASPVLYAQFGRDVSPGQVLKAMGKTFDRFYDQAEYHELCSVATELYIKENRQKPDALWPLISPICPVVNRLIAYRFPSLVKHIAPIIAPRELAARELKKRMRGEGLLKTEEVGVYQVTSCAAMMISIKKPMFLESSFLDGALGINEVYEMIAKHLKDPGKGSMPDCISGVGVGWGLSGGEIAGMGEGNYLAVSGIQETIRYLEKIEMGLLRDMEYIEFRACLEGCIGGPMTVADRYQAKRTLQKLTRLCWQEKRVDCGQVQKSYAEGWFFAEKARVQQEDHAGRLSLSAAIERQEKAERILKSLPRKECGLCGCPDCKTFAEDVAEGKAVIEDCVVLTSHKHRKKRKRP
jgi:Na+-translocating ferredoxin:NAD+ oxidoreductase RNF subunit RnfB